MKIIVPEAKPFDIEPISADLPTPSYGQTLKAQAEKVVNPVAEGLKFYTGEEDYDSNSIDRIERFIETQSFSDRHKRYLRSYGVGSEDNAYADQRNFEFQ